MPYLLIQTNRKLSDEQQLSVAAQASKLLAKELGKPENYVMVAVQAGRAMTFAGTADFCAYLELKSIGLPENRSKPLSAALGRFVEQYLQVPQNRVYIEFSDAQAGLWGWNGGTF